MQGASWVTGPGASAAQPTPLPLRHVERPDAIYSGTDWAGTSSTVASQVAERSAKALATYRDDHLLIDEHANKELGTAQGGYGRRQVYELVQNAADELISQPGGMVKLVLTDHALYCANEGRPLSVDGVNALLMSDLSVKRGSEIGRFGLGFKSVLAITRRPMFLSRSGSFRFDPTEAERQIRQIRPRAERVPYLRTAVPLEPDGAAADDEVLRELMAWATTVVKLPRDLDAAKWLSEDLQRFPAEFLLFSPHVGTLAIEDRTSGLYRVGSVRPSGEELELIEDGRATRWMTFRRDHRPSDAAKADAGEISRRDVVPVIWAVRTAGQLRRGRFWAFFPTEEETTLSGIINAPWKTNNDRQALLEGDFNRELVQVAAELVAENLARLVTPEDPGRLFDILPARGRESPSWADGVIGDQVYALASHMPCLPDQSGLLRPRSEVKFPPSEAPEAALSTWEAFEGRPRDWLHHSVLTTRERRSKAERLHGDRNAAADYSSWLEALAADGQPASSIAALKVAEACLSANLRRHEEGSVRAAQILLTADGSATAVDPRTVFLYRPGSTTELLRVHPEVQQDPEAYRILLDRQIRDVGLEDEYAGLLRQIEHGFGDWDRFWRDTAQLPGDRALSLLRARPVASSLVKFRTAGGTFEDRRYVLLPGGVLTEVDGDDARSTVDVAYHDGTLDVVRGLGVQAGPIHDGAFPNEWWLDDYLSDARDSYEAATRDLRQRPDRDYLKLSLSGVLGPLSPMLHLSEPAVARFTAQIVGTEPDHRIWKVEHATMKTYPAIEVIDPVSWFVRQYGLLPTSLGPAPASQAVGPGLRHLGSVLPVVTCTEQWARRLGLPESPADLDSLQWAAALTAAEDVSPANAAALYLTAFRHAARPSRLRCVVGGRPEVRPTDAVFLTADPNEAAAAAESDTAVLYLPDAVLAGDLAAAWGVAPLRGLIETHVDAVPLQGPVPLLEAFPDLRPFVQRRDRQLELVRCSDLRFVSVGPGGLRASRINFVREAEKLYWREPDSPNDAALLHRLSAELDLGLNDADVQEILSGRENDRRGQLLAEVRQEPDERAKLLRAVGAEAIRRHLSPQMIAGVEETEGALDDFALAGLASSVYGIDLFREFRHELLQRGLAPPERWSGAPNARRFVQALGLPREYAGFEEPRLDPLLEVDGPAELPPLHPFQEELTRRIRLHLASRENKRALLSLPTGAGKTRVTVEALVRAIRDDGMRGPILWSAPTQELCEQAVQTWAYVWRSVGPRIRLRISRLWEGRDAEASERGEAHVVVATSAQLASVREQPEYDWLARASVVIVDEAHGSTETGYTKIFHWLGLGREKERDRCPLLGLTATPFKGSSVEGTERLLRRYGSTMLDDGVLGDHPTEALQEMRVLARAKQQILTGGTVDLSEEQADKAMREQRLPIEIEEQLGEDQSRNETILRTVLQLDPTWKILVFATSVSHAQQLAAILGLRGVRAAVIHGNTNPAARRHYVDQFNHGDLRVLTNYGVLAEGFDAPSVRCVIVARPTLSPGLYQQMIGRGLRGPMNGGKDECLIVNVEDNILRFGGQLAFRHFDYLFDRG